VQVTATGTAAEYCNVESWGAETVRVRCRNNSTFMANARFMVMYLKTPTAAPGVAYAWADQPALPSYTPHAAYSYNGAGGAITATRTGTGQYTMTWAGFGALGSGGGHAQVTAYGPLNGYCELEGWSGDSVDVRCYSGDSAPLDLPYSVLYLRPEATDDGLAFAWADDPLSASYSPDPLFRFNAGDGAVTAQRLATGTYRVTFGGFALRGLGGGHVHVTSYQDGGSRCEINDWGPSPDPDWSVDVSCVNTDGGISDSRFAVLALKPVALPEPGAVALVAGALLTAALTRWRRRAPLVVLVMIGLAPFVSSAHDQSYGYASVDDPTAPLDSPWGYNDAGNPPTAARVGPGRYTVTFRGLSALGATGGNVQVQSTESETLHYCKVEGWIGDTVSVACFDGSGIPSDSEYSVLYMMPDAHPNHYAFALADRPTDPGYTPDPSRSYNAGGVGAVTATRTGTGVYVMRWAGISAVGVGGGNIQVTAHGSGNARCRVDGWESETASVRCFDAAGAPADSAYSILYLRPDADDPGLAFGWASQPAVDEYTPDSFYSYDAGDGTPRAYRRSVGEYAMTWPGMHDGSLMPAIAHVTAYGDYSGPDARCKAISWGTSGVALQCLDTAGNPADAYYTALFVRAPTRAWTQEYAFTRADQPTTVRYTPDPHYAYNQLGGGVEVARTGIGRYTVQFDLFDGFVDGGNVQITAVGASGEYCKVASWTPDSVDVRCFAASGLAADARFTALYLKATSTPSPAYAWANQPSAASYTPSAFYSHNPRGGITATRSGPGVYQMTWTGYALVSGGGHPQVTAYGGTNERCQIAAWGGDSVSVRCFDSAGDPADSQYSVLYARPFAIDDVPYDGIAYAWANDAIAASYTPNAAYRYNVGDGPVQAQRLGPGSYRMIFGGFALRGLRGGSVHVSAYGNDDRRCAIGDWGPITGTTDESVDVRCHDAAGAPADALYNVLFLKPVALPEPGVAALVAGAVFLLALARQRSALHQAAMRSTSSSSTSASVRPERLSTWNE
jgi:hypothetical protein